MLKQVVFVFCICWAEIPKIAYGQNHGVYPFVSIQDEALITDNTTLKIFTTTILLDVIVAYDRTAFEEAAQRFYGQSAGLQGFQSVSNIVSNPLNSTQIQLTFDVTYTFLTLRESVNSSDNAIGQAIGQLSSVKRGLEENSTFSSQSRVSSISTSFEFNGNSLCDSVGCHQGTFTICKENTMGVSVMCTSMCKSNFCRNGGWCHQVTASEEPYCSCPTSNLEWHIGRHCESYVHLWMPVLFLVIVFLLLVIIAATSWIFYRDAKRREPSLVAYKLHGLKSKSKNVFSGKVNFKPQRKNYIMQQRVGNKKFGSGQNNTQLQKSTMTTAAAAPKDESPLSAAKEVKPPRYKTVDESPNFPPKNEGRFAQQRSHEPEEHSSSVDADETEVHPYELGDRSLGFDWRNRTEPNATENDGENLTVTHARPQKKDKIKSFISESKLI